MALFVLQPTSGGLFMRKLTREEFVELIILNPDFDVQKGMTEFEIDIAFWFFNIGRQSVRW